MFGKKQSVASSGRQRPQTAQRRSSAVFSYHASRSTRPASGNAGRDVKAQQKEAQSAAAERRNTRGRWLRRGPLGLLLATMLLLAGTMLNSRPLIVQSGDSRGAIFLRSPGVYQQAADALFGNSVRNRSKITINATRLAEQLERQFPELGNVTVTLPLLGQRAVVHIEPRVPALILSPISGQSFVLDTTGRALITPAQAPGVSKLNLPVITDQSGLSIAPGRIALPGVTVAFIREVVGQLKAAHLTPSSLTLPKGTSELDVRVNGAPYYIKFNVRGDARAEAGTFLAVKQKLDREHKTPGTYLDVRVDGRAYYK